MLESFFMVLLLRVKISTSRAETQVAGVYARQGYLRDALLPQVGEEGDEFGAHAAQLLAVRGGEGFEHPTALGRHFDKYFAAIFFGTDAHSQALIAEAVDETDRAVVFGLEALAEFGDGDLIASGETVDREEGLMLLGRKAGGDGGVLAETEEAPQRIAESG